MMVIFYKQCMYGYPLHYCIHVQEVRAEIERLPQEPSDDLRGELQKLLRLVSCDMHDQLWGKTDGDKTVLQSFQAIFSKFELALKDSLPAFEVRISG